MRRKSVLAGFIIAALLMGCQSGESIEKSSAKDVSVSSSVSSTAGSSLDDDKGIDEDGKSTDLDKDSSKNSTENADSSEAISIDENVCLKDLCKDYFSLGKRGIYHEDYKQRTCKPQEWKSSRNL